MCLAQSKHILLIEDDLSLRRILSFLLVQKGFQVTVCSTIVEAMTKLSNTELKALFTLRSEAVGE